MDSITQFAVLTVATLIAAATAFAMAWVFLRGAFRLMRRATVRPSASASSTQASPVGLELVRGSRAAVQHFALHR
jgi:hypothetical protein